MNSNVLFSEKYAKYLLAKLLQTTDTDTDTELSSWKGLQRPSQIGSTHGGGAYGPHCLLPHFKMKPRCCNWFAQGHQDLHSGLLTSITPRCFFQKLPLLPRFPYPFHLCFKKESWGVGGERGGREIHKKSWLIITKACIKERNINTFLVCAPCLMMPLTVWWSQLKEQEKFWSSPDSGRLSRAGSSSLQGTPFYNYLMMFAGFSKFTAWAVHQSTKYLLWNTQKRGAIFKISISLSLWGH